MGDMSVGQLTTSVMESNPVILQSKVANAMLGKTLDIVQQQGDAFVKMLESSVAPNLGQNFDVKV